MRRSLSTLLKSELSELEPARAASVLINVRTDVGNEHQDAVEEAEVPWKNARKYLRWTGIVMNKLTDLTGSTWTVVLVLAVIVAWAIWGIFKKGSSDWQIVMQNFSSIQAYLWDLTLLNAQRCDYAELDRIFEDLICNSQTQRELMPRVLQSPKAAAHLAREMQTIMAMLPHAKGVAKLPKKSRFGWFADKIAKGAGSIPVQLIYVGGIIAWLAVGPMLGWGSKWQLYINTAVALELTIMECFLQNTMRRHRKYLSQCSMLTETQDRALTNSLYRALGKEVDTAKLSRNHGPAVEGSWQGTESRHWYERWVAWYSVFMGSLAGLLLSIAVFIVWAGIGSLMGFGNPNWLLIIGTYTGLSGFFNAFVLRYCMRRMDWTTEKNAEHLDAADKKLMDLLKVKFEPLPEVRADNVFKKASMRFSTALGTYTALIGSIFVIIVLLVAASVLSWSETGQLLANTPTMIIEGFLLVFLMYSQVAGDRNMRQQLAALLQRRMEFSHAIQDLGTG